MRIRHTIALLLSPALALLPEVAASAAPPAKPAAPAPFASVRLLIRPQTVTLDGPYSEARVLVEGQDKNGIARDLSADAVLTVTDSKIAVADDGTLRPRRDGRTELVARVGGRETRIPVTVKGAGSREAPRFLHDVLPVLSRNNCSGGACHGANSGKGGFKLSLLGYDPEMDWENITRADAARRVSPTDPENSLLLRKPSLAVAHRGGLKLKKNSADYRLVRDWIARGMPGPDPKEARVVRLEVIPKVRTLAVGEAQRFLVSAIYADGTRRDATPQTLFTSSDDSTVQVAPNGTGRALQHGEGAVVIRYQGLVATARVLSPFGTPRKYVARPDEQPIDRLVNSKLAQLGLDASGRASDGDFLRRATLDVTGMLPTPDEARRFLSDKSPDKREKLIDALLERPEFTDFWAQRWGDILRVNRARLGDKGMNALYGWVRRSVAENKPWNKFARELLLAQGDTGDGPVNYFRNAQTPTDLTEQTSQVFLGVRIQCAKCHNHPYERWTQNQYYEMAAFFARVRSKQTEGGAAVVFAANGGEVQHPKTKRDVTPTALDATPLPASFDGDRRQAFADWLTGPDNPFFAKILVNRVWRHFMGVGLVEPVDDMRATNPPSNEALMDTLARDFVKGGFDLKCLMRTIMRSETYQRSPLTTGNNAPDGRFYSHALFKRLSAEPLMDALASVTGVPEKFAGYPAGTRACQLPDTAVSSYFLDLFGRPARSTTCECERIDAPNLGQILHLMNNAGIQGRLASKEGRIGRLMEARTPDAKVVEDFYLAAFSRFPTQAETKQAVALLAKSKDRQRAAEDLLWALLNSKEFLFNH